MTKKEIRKIEGIIDSLYIDPNNRMLNFESAVLTMIEIELDPISLFCYIDDKIYWNDSKTKPNDIKKHRYLNDPIFACKLTESYLKKGGE
jgi:hypothetical protein